MKTYAFALVAPNTPSKHLKRLNGALLPLNRALHLYGESTRLRDRRAKSEVRSLNAREWTDPYFGLPEA